MHILTLALLFSTPSLVCSLRGASRIAISEDGFISNSIPSAIPCPGPFSSKEDPQVSKCNSSNQMILHSDGGYFCCTVVEPNKTITRKWNILANLEGQQQNDRLGFGEENGAGVALSGNGKRIVVASRSRDSKFGKASGSIEIYEDTSNPFAPNSWTLVGQPIYGASAAEFLGWSVAINKDGSIVAVSSGRYRGSAGSYQGDVRVYKLDQGTWPAQWVQMGGDIIGDDLLDYFGFSVALCEKGTRVAIGGVQHVGIENKPYPGYVKVYTWEDNTKSWVQLGQTLIGEEDGNRFGSAVSLSGEGNVLAVGAPNAAFGYVMTFGFDGLQWKSIGQTIYSDVLQDKTGYSVALSKNGKTLAMGAPHGGNALTGVVRVYFLNHEFVWQSMGEIEGEEEGMESGSSIAISADGTRLVIGAIQANGQNNAHEGEIRLYEYQKSSWVPVGEGLFGEHGSDNLGYVVSIDSEGRRVAASAPFASVEKYSHAGIVKVLEMQ